MSKYSIIKKYKKENNIKLCSFIIFLRYIKARLTYRIGVNAFLDNKLYDCKIDHSEYYSKLHTYIHKWKYCSNKYAFERSKWWLFRHHIQYYVFKILYPGLDAMDYFRYEFYRLKHKSRKDFITEGYLKKMNNHFNPYKGNEEFYKMLDNKMSFNTFFNDYLQRKWICINDNKKEIIDFCKEKNTVFAKPINGGGGVGIEKFVIKNAEDAGNIFLKYNNKKYILEEAIEQCNQMNKLNGSSINTIRVYSVVFNDDIHVVGATLRFGNGKSIVDNYSSGNYAASIDVITGIVDSTAINQDGERISVHPISKCEIVGFKIPCWNETIELVKKAHNKITTLRYIGWDVAINSNNEVLLIEGNTYAGVELQQHPKLVGKKPLYRQYW